MTEIYRRHLGRDAQPSELDSWASRIATGMSSIVSVTFVLSFAALSGAHNSSRSGTSHVVR